MEKVEQKVFLLAYTPDALNVVYSACRQCYSKFSAYDAFNDNKEDGEKAILVRKVLSSGHMSPLEHVSLTFGIEGISRACSHQLVRHRLASYSQQSQRYVGLGHLPYVIPPSIAANKEAKKLFEDTLAYIEKSYNKILNILDSEASKKSEQSKQDARFLLPNACETKIVVTMNARQLLHFFSLRCCTRAQWEIRMLANKMLEISKGIMPVIFEKAGPKCEMLGYCPEGDFSCGRYPALETLKECGGANNA